jgi:hypothetical protein
VVQIPEDKDNDEIVPFVVSDLPTDASQIKKLVKKFTKGHSDEAEHVAQLVLRRVRDLHDPLGSSSETDEKVVVWNKFILGLLEVWLRSEDSIAKVYKNHLQEIISQQD